VSTKNQDNGIEVGRKSFKICACDVIFARPIRKINENVLMKTPILITNLFAHIHFLQTERKWLFRVNPDEQF